MTNDLTPQYLVDKGFKLINRTISGADMWQGVPLWKKGDIKLYGKLSTASGGVLYPFRQYCVQISTVQQLDSFLDLCVYETN